VLRLPADEESVEMKKNFTLKKQKLKSAKESLEKEKQELTIQYEKVKSTGNAPSSSSSPSPGVHCASGEWTLTMRARGVM
jgi:hypothetical protein